MAHSTSAKFIFRVLLITLVTCVLAEEMFDTDAGVVAKGYGTSRVKREVNKQMVGFNDKEKKAILDRHNHVRGLEKATNMMMMRWDPKLEKMAQKWAENCEFEHSPLGYVTNVPGYGNVGENLYLSTAEFEPAGVIQVFYDEVKYYNYDKDTCQKDKICGHYTQVVWADSQAIGCGAKYCNKLKKKFGVVDSAYIMVCHYGPAGNYIGMRPYKKGPVCSECPKNAPFCVKGLCTPTPQSVSGSSSIQNSRSRSGLFFLFMAVMWFVLRIIV